MSVSIFMDYVDNDDNGCWNWTGRRVRNTPIFRQTTARLWVWRTSFGSEPERPPKPICNNPDCVNPEHLSDDQEKIMETSLMAQAEVDDNGCWVWTGRLENGRPAFFHNHARRWSFDHFIGGAGRYARIMVFCGNELCVNPAHLYEYDKATLYGYETCSNGHAQIPGHMTTDTNGNPQCKLCKSKQQKGTQ